MNRFHLFYDGPGPKPAEDIALVRAMHGVQIVNDALPRSVVVDVSGDLAEQRLRRLASWTLRQSHPVSIGAPVIEHGLNKAVPALRLVVKNSADTE